ncbi:hypothetical protein L1987_02804 [Smallanthus sonchifolius]|uniref:Uncharacterized protein n=1 Tax=Smallanthus sonchifolius TaxID=185202 RepID=A0ACB9K8U2_9ASTR|nr:hypothetical protein L1987_02804 [Smallanthus sonchifolius]
MHSVKEKVSNAAKAQVESYKANLEEKVPPLHFTTTCTLRIHIFNRKNAGGEGDSASAKEAEGKMNLHDEKAEHAAEKIHGKHHVLGHDSVTGHHQQPLGAVDPVTGTNLSSGRTSSWT